VESKLKTKRYVNLSLEKLARILPFSKIENIDITIYMVYNDIKDIHQHSGVDFYD